MSVLWRSLDTIAVSPPGPPSARDGLPRGTNFSRRKAIHPLPPSPALILMIASSINMGYSFDCTVRCEDSPQTQKPGLPIRGARITLLSSIFMIARSVGAQNVSFSFVANRFNVVSVRVKNERAVVVWVIVRTRPGRIIVARSGSESCVVESVDHGTVITRKRYMDRHSATARHVSFRLWAKADRPTLLDPEIRNELSTKPCTRSSFHSERIT